jgi:hypothetical protein
MLTVKGMAWSATYVLEKPDGIGDEEAERDSKRSRLLRADMVVDVCDGAMTETLPRRRDRDDAQDARAVEHVGRILVEQMPAFAELGGAREVDEEQRRRT